MTEISNARQAIRDYAREYVVVDEVKVIATGQPPETGVTVKFSAGEHLVTGVRGELAGLTFEALQNVLELTETRLGETRLVPANQILEAVAKVFRR